MTDFGEWYRSQETIGAKQARKLFGRIHFSEPVHLGRRLDACDKWARTHRLVRFLVRRSPRPLKEQVKHLIALAVEIDSW